MLGGHRTIMRLVVDGTVVPFNMAMAVTALDSDVKLEFLDPTNSNVGSLVNIRNQWQVDQIFT